MQNLDYTYWQGKNGWLVGYLNVWPEHWTQGKTIEELEEMLTDLYEFYKEEQTEKKGGILQILCNDNPFVKEVLRTGREIL